MNIYRFFSIAVQMYYNMLAIKVQEKNVLTLEQI